MSSTFTSRSSPPRADYALKAELQAEYVKQLWLLLSAIIGLLTIINWSRRLHRAVRSPKPQEHGLDTFIENGHPVGVVTFPSNKGNGRASLRRIPQAMSSVFRILAFRTTVPIGPSSVMSVLELTFIIGYVAALLTWLWINSEF